MPTHVRIYTDGGARGNPGPAAGAAVLKTFVGGKEGEVIAEAAKYLPHDTNNQAEYTGIIVGLQKAKELGVKHVDMKMDSELAVKQLNGIYRVKNPELAKRYLEVKNLCTYFESVSFSHVRREQNTEADALVNKTIDAHLSRR